MRGAAPTLASAPVLALFVIAAACGGGGEGDPHEHEGRRVDEPGALPARVEIAPEAVAGMGIEIGEAMPGASVPEGTIPAEIVAEPTRTAHVGPLVAGRIASVDVTVGSEVAAGDVLATLASATAADLTSAAAQAGARVAAAEAALERATFLRERGIAGEAAVIEARTELDTARAERAGLARQRGVVRSAGRGEVRIVAPIAGHVIEVLAAPGATLDVGQTALVIVDTSRVWAVGHAPEMLAGEVEAGAPVRLRLFAYGDERWEGALSWVAPVLDEETHTLAVRLELENERGRLRPRMMGVLEIVARDQPGVVRVPREAVVELRGASLVFVPADEPGAFRVVPVAVARQDADEAVIASGLEAGARVVTRGAFVLESALLRHELEDEGHAH